jgi:PiT family inorganic phosphate transporter
MTSRTVSVRWLRSMQLIETGQVSSKSAVTPFMLFLGGIGIVIGLATYGYKVMGTIGNKITELTPTRGYCATIAASFVVVLASGLGTCRCPPPISRWVR